jgi:hypothetical protein
MVSSRGLAILVSFLPLAGCADNPAATQQGIAPDVGAAVATVHWTHAAYEETFNFLAPTPHATLGEQALCLHAGRDLEVRNLTATATWAADTPATAELILHVESEAAGEYAMASGASPITASVPVLTIPFGSCLDLRLSAPAGAGAEAQVTIGVDYDRPDDCYVKYAAW